MVTSQEMPIYHPNSQEELAGLRPQERIKPAVADDVSTMDDTGLSGKLPSNAIPKFEHLDKFQRPNAKRDREGNEDQQQGFNSQTKSSKKQVTKDEAADFYRATPRTLSATVFPVIDWVARLLVKVEQAARAGLFSFIDLMIKIVADMDEELEELELSLDDAFKQWNDSFKPNQTQKRKPPTVSPIKPSYIRQEFQVNRSPHMWKTDPKKPGILTFGPFKTLNNKVTEILFKYQNNTVEAKA